MKLLVLLGLLAACAMLTSPCAAARDIMSVQKSLTDSLRSLQPGRALLQQPCGASSFSAGSSASATASSVNTGGPSGCTSGTTGMAQGPNAQTAQVSQAGSNVQTCFQGPSNAVACSTLAPSVKSANCSDIAPDTTFTCAEQAKFGKCDADFIFLGAFCLSSCNRCGSGCVDTAPSGMTCDVAACNSTEITAGPYCLKTCERCSPVA